MSTHLPLAETRLQPASQDEASELGKIFENSQIIFENEDVCFKTNLHNLLKEDLPALGWVKVESAQTWRCRQSARETGVIRSILPFYVWVI